MTEFTDYKVDLPLVDDECKNGTCGHVHQVEVSNKPPQPKVTVKPTSPSVPTAPEPVQEQTHDHNHDIQVNHAQLSEIMPGGTNYAKCADGSCGTPLIQNSKLTKKFKSCPNCDSNGVPKKNEFCPTCGTTEPKEEDAKEDFWNDSDIDSEKIGEDED